MALTVTMPATYDRLRLQRFIETRMLDRLADGYSYAISGSNLTVDQLNEADRTRLEQAITDYSATEAERQQVVSQYQANLDFLALTSPTQAQVLAQVKSLTRQVNYIARTLLQ